jgi:hypothetical protein
VYEKAHAFLPPYLAPPFSHQPSTYSYVEGRKAKGEGRVVVLSVCAKGKGDWSQNKTTAFKKHKSLDFFITSTTVYMLYSTYTR